MAKNHFLDPKFLGPTNKKQFLVKNSEMWQKSSKGTNLRTTFFFGSKLIFFELLTKKYQKLLFFGKITFLGKKNTKRIYVRRSGIVSTENF